MAGTRAGEALHAGRSDARGRTRASPSAAGCVLVVDDDAPTREMLGLLLEQEGYDVMLVHDGHAALCYLLTHALPGCILLDVWMPTMGGLAFRRAQQDVPALAAIPVIAMSAQRRGPWMDATLHVAGYLEKPFTRDQLCALVVQVGCTPPTHR